VYGETVRTIDTRSGSDRVEVDVELEVAFKGLLEEVQVRIVGTLIGEQEEDSWVGRALWAILFDGRLKAIRRGDIVKEVVCTLFLMLDRPPFQHDARTLGTPNGGRGSVRAKIAELVYSVAPVLGVLQARDLTVPSRWKRAERPSKRAERGLTRLDADTILAELVGAAR
jgi:hypothetical protein